MSNEDITLARRCAEKMLAEDLASRSLGMTIEIPAVGESVVTMTVTESMTNGHAMCHGGYIFTLADSAFAFACNAYNRVTVAAGAQIDFLAPAKLGDVLIAQAQERHRSGKSGVYDIIVTRDDGTTIALFRGRSLSIGGEIV